MNMKKYIYIIILFVVSQSLADSYQVCSHEDCEIFVSNSLSRLNQIVSDVHAIKYPAETSLYYANEIISLTGSSTVGDMVAIRNRAENQVLLITDLTNHLEKARLGYVILREEINSIDCSQCYGEDTNECCCCEYLPQILDELKSIELYVDGCYQMLDFISYEFRILLEEIKSNQDEIILDLGLGFHSVTNLLNLIMDEGIGSFDVRLDEEALFKYQAFSPLFAPLDLYTYVSGADNIVSHLASISLNYADTSASINNYLYKFIYFSFPSYTNQVSSHFSFFKDNMVGVRAPLDSSVKFSDYYVYLTNFYVEAVNENNSASTNWFQRVESLIAALVFADSVGSSNTVNSSYGPEDPDGLISQISDSFGDLENNPKNSLFALRDTSQSLVSSVRKFSSSFSDASMPGTVKLFTIGSSPSDVLASDSGDSIEFNTSDGGVFFEMCRCVTTIIWTLGGIFLLVVFLSWSARTSYNLFLFCWDVFNGVFVK